MRSCDEIGRYIVSLYQYIPTSVKEGLVLVFIIGAILMLAFAGFKKGIRYSASLLLMEYVFLLFCSTVIFRYSINKNLGYEFRPFWSYSRDALVIENIMNVVVFVPIGLLVGWLFRSMTWRKVLIIGGSISIMVEGLQYFYERGFAEVDDVIHNTVGCLIGFGIYSIVRVGYEKACKRRLGVM